LNRSVSASSQVTSLAIQPTVLFKCLTDEIRLKSLLLIQHQGELCVCELMVALNEDSQPKVSRNLAMLKQAKLLLKRKQGQWSYYRINPDLPQWIQTILAETLFGNTTYIQANLQQLALMQNRPEKLTCC